jgi:sialate O-acetylesterase
VTALHRHALFCFLVAAAVLMSERVHADVRLSALFSDHMVLQCDREVPVWGWAEPGEKMTVTFAGQTVASVAGADGRWRVVLQAMKPSFESRPLQVAGRTTVVINDVLVGEVWLASGQSNMFWPVGRARDGQKEAAAAQYPGLRLFQVPSVADGRPRSELSGQWAVCSPASVAGFSAVAYYFGRQLHKALNVPVGLVHASIRGSVAEAWMSRAALDSVAASTPIDREWKDCQSSWKLPLYPDPGRHVHAYWEASLKGLADYMVRWSALTKQGHKNAREAMSKEYLAEVEQHQAIDRTFKHSVPSVFYNGMIHPLAPYALRGMIWYQGESNVPRAEGYRAVLAALIRDWRTLWGRDDLPFLVVGLANYTPRLDQPGDSDWARLREAQVQVQQSLTHVGLATTIDIGEAANIHAKNKQEVGGRLARIALAGTYGQKLEYCGPVFQSMEKTPHGLALRFSHAEGGLAAGEAGPVKGFAVAGADRTWHWAEATLTNEIVTLTCAEVKEPVAVRYAWANNPEANLCNKDQLPAVPFRTDDWPWIRDGKKQEEFQ